jgi:hypothetical protein
MCLVDYVGMLILSCKPFDTLVRPTIFCVDMNWAGWRLL